MYECTYSKQTRFIEKFIEIKCDGMNHVYYVMCTMSCVCLTGEQSSSESVGGDSLRTGDHRDSNCPRSVSKERVALSKLHYQNFPLLRWN